MFKHKHDYQNNVILSVHLIEGYWQKIIKQKLCHKVWYVKEVARLVPQNRGWGVLGVKADLSGCFTYRTILPLAQIKSDFN